jgi:hypothetical protein|nr:MAG TPA: hypothetical protein [Caudoviricetes sp.]
MKKHVVMKNSKSEADLMILLNAIPYSQNKIEPCAGKKIAQIIAGMKHEGLLGKSGKESVFKIKLKEGEYICLLDTKQELKRVFLLADIDL